MKTTQYPITISTALELLRAGELVAFPTETVYGLGADARNKEAVAKIFQAKNRPQTHPLIVHIADVSELACWAIDVGNEALLLAKTFWPGPLTLILKKHPSVLTDVTGGQTTIGVRIPAHPIARELLQAYGAGLAAPSANQFTHVSPTSSRAVYDELAGKIAGIIEGGNCAVGVESTIIDMTNDAPNILRPGMISAHAIAEILGQNVQANQAASGIRTAGMHHKHYAPRTKTRLLNSQTLADFDDHGDEKAIALVRDIERWPELAKLHYHQMPADPTQYAQVLYSTLRACDGENYSHIFIEAVPDADPAWAAIDDRIKKATAKDNL